MIKIWLFFLLAVLTCGYAWLVQLGLGIFNMMYDPAFLGEPSLLTRMMTSSTSIVFWQVSGFASLLICIYWANIRCKSLGTREPVTLPALCHSTWIIASFLWIVFFSLDPFFVVGYSLGS